jgi:hypothetical protein
VQDEWFLTTLGVTRRIEVLAMIFNSVPQHIVGTKRVAMIHRRLAEHYARYLTFRILAPCYALPQLTEAVQWHSLFTKTRAVGSRTAQAIRYRSLSNSGTRVKRSPTRP